PSGTGSRCADPRIGVLHRAGKEGLGRAYLAGFAVALERGYRYAVEIDADGSHPPETLPALLAVAEAGADLAIGSRWIAGGRTVDWSRGREWLSRSANAYARWILRIPVADTTAGFRVYRTELLRRLDLGSVRSQGYYFQVEMTVRTIDAGGAVAEVPIVFAERAEGASKMSLAIVVEAMLKVTALGVRRLFRR
ncbi:MAG: glycosyltransferase, partial [Microbacteriaceae bacterium]|nr:glycosyltransferase [Microbacteriaceae bacterium]